MKLTRRDLAALGCATLASPALLRRTEAATPRDTLVVVREISSIADWNPAVSQILECRRSTVISTIASSASTHARPTHR